MRRGVWTWGSVRNLLKIVGKHPVVILIPAMQEAAAVRVQMLS
jgi:hypothetical protein